MTFRTSFGRGLAAAVALAGLFAASPALAQSAPPPPGGAPGGDGQRGEGQREGGQRREGRGGFGRGMGQMMRFDQIFRPEFDRSDAPMLMQELQLTESQRVATEALIDAYDIEFRAKSEPLQEKVRVAGEQVRDSFMSEEVRQRFRDEMMRGMEELRRMQEQGNVDPEQMRQMVQERMQALQAETQKIREQSGEAQKADKLIADMISELELFRGQKKALREDFLANLRSQLDDTQVAEWPAVDRKLTRVKTLPQGRLSGESVDLLAVVAGMRFDEETMATLSPVLAEYEGALDLALTQRNEKLAASEAQLFRAITQGRVKEAMAVGERQAQAHVAVRDVNDQYIETIVSLLPEEKGPEFRAEAQRDAFNRFYRTTYAQRVFDATKDFEDLDGEILVAILELEMQYQNELQQLTQKAIELTKKEEPKELETQAQGAANFFAGDWSSMMGGRGPFGRGGLFGGGGEEDPIQKVQDDRRDLGDRYIERVKNLLTPQQAALLPERQQGGRGFWGGQGGAGGGPGGGQGGFGGMTPEQQQEMVKRFDKNGDGQLNDEERRAAFEEFGRRFREGRGGGGNNGA